MGPAIDLRLGVDERHRSAAAALYYDAFAQLLAPILGEPAEALALLGPALDLERAVAAVEIGAPADIDPKGDGEGDGDDDGKKTPGRLVGVCGLHFEGRHFVALRARPMLRAFGLIDGLRRILIGGLLDHQPRPGELVIDGIAVLPAARGQGVGSLLLDELERFARAQGLRALSLDVAADNTRACQLYRRFGFVERRSSTSLLIRRAFGVSAILSMSKRLS